MFCYIPLEVAEFFTEVFDCATTMSFALTCKRFHSFMSYDVSPKFFLALGNKRERYMDAVENGYTGIARELISSSRLSEGQGEFLLELCLEKDPEHLYQVMEDICTRQPNLLAPPLSRDVLRGVGPVCSVPRLQFLLSLPKIGKDIELVLPALAERGDITCISFLRKNVRVSCYDATARAASRAGKVEVLKMFPSQIKRIPYTLCREAIISLENPIPVLECCFRYVRSRSDRLLPCYNEAVQQGNRRAASYILDNVAPDTRQELVDAYGAVPAPVPIPSLTLAEVAQSLPDGEEDSASPYASDEEETENREHVQASPLLLPTVRRLEPRVPFGPVPQVPFAPAQWKHISFRHNSYLIPSDIDTRTSKWSSSIYHEGKMYKSLYHLVKAAREQFIASYTPLAFSTPFTGSVGAGSPVTISKTVMDAFRVAALTGDITFLTWLQHNIPKEYAIPDDLGILACETGMVDTFIWMEKSGFYSLQDSEDGKRCYMHAVNKALSESFSLARILFSITAPYRRKELPLAPAFGKKCTKQDVEDFIAAGFPTLDIAESLSKAGDVVMLQWMYERGHVTAKDIALSLRTRAARRVKTKPHVVTWMDSVIAAALE